MTSVVGLLSILWVLPIIHQCTVPVWIHLYHSGSENARPDARKSVISTDLRRHGHGWTLTVMDIWNRVRLTVLDLAMFSYKHCAQWVWILVFDFKYNWMFSPPLHNAMQHSSRLFASERQSWFCAWVSIKSFLCFFACIGEIIEDNCHKNLACGRTVKFLNMRFNCHIVDVGSTRFNDQIWSNYGLNGWGLCWYEWNTLSIKITGDLCR